MAWEEVYPSSSSGKRPLQDHSIAALVYRHLKPIKQTTPDEWEAQIHRSVPHNLRQPHLENLQKCVKCVALLWGVYDQIHSKKESLTEVVKAMTAFVPSTGPANVGDLITLAADIAKDYVASYSQAIRDKIQPNALSQEQRAILEFLNPAQWTPNQSVADWAGELLDIGEYGIWLVQSASNTGRVSQVNIDAMEQYARVVRPMLYLYQRDRAGFPLTSVR